MLPTQTQEWEIDFFLHPRYLRLAFLQLGGWTGSPYQANYSCSSPLLSALQNGWKLQDKKGFHD